ncbi:MAG TPA: hypothetical protein VF519_07385 [Mycobacteriales bacterium]
MTPRTRTAARAAAVLAAAASALVAAGAPAGAEPSTLSNVVSTAAANGAARVDATCHFGPVVPDNFEDQMVVTGVATAAGATSVTIACTWEDWWGDDSAHDPVTAAGPVVVLDDTRPHWRSAVRVCVSASAVFATGPVVVAPKVCA